MVLTFFSTLILPLEYAIYLGILSTILIHLGESSHMNLSYIIEKEDGQFVELPLKGIMQEEPNIAIINIEGDLYFAAVQDLQDQVDQILETNIKVLILRFRRTHLLASTGIMALDYIIRAARDNHVQILFCGIQKEVFVPLKAAGVTETVGSAHIFHAKYQLFESTQSALEEAKKIIHSQRKPEKTTTEVDQ